MDKVKLTARYVVIGFILWLAYTVTSSEWLTAVDKLDPTNINVIIGFVFSALTLVLQKHFDTKIEG